MKKLIIAFAALTMSFSSLDTSAQCSAANFCGSFFSSWDLTDVWVLVDPAGNFLWDQGNCGIVWGSPSGQLFTGDAVIFLVEECQTYIWSMCGLGVNQFDAVMSLWTNTAVPQILCLDDDFCSFFGPSQISWSATFTGSVVLTVNNFFCGNFNTPYELLLLGSCSQQCVANDNCDDAIELCCALPTSSSKSSKGSKSSKSSKSGSSSASSAVQQTCPNSALGSTIGAIFDNVGFCGTSNTAGGVWYKVTAQENGTIVANTCSPNTNYDTKLSVFEGACGALVCVGGNDDDFGLPCVNFQSRVTFCTTVGTTYYILVHGFSSATGNFELTLDCGPSPASNDDIANSICLDLGCGETVTADFNNLCATADGPSPGGGTIGQAPSCNATDGWCSFEANVDNDLWYCFIAPCVEGTVSIEADGFDTQLAIWAQNGVAGSKSCKSAKSPCKSSKGSKSSKSGSKACECKCAPDPALLIEIAANDDGLVGGAAFAAGLKLNVPNDLEPGKKYWIQVDGFAGATGQGQVTLKHTPTDCSGCGENATTATVIIGTDNFGGETSWVLNDLDAGTTIGSAAGLTSSSVLVENFCVPNDHCYEFIVFDSFGDGLCGCGFGNGFYAASITGGDAVGPICWDGNAGCGFAGLVSARHTLAAAGGDCTGKDLATVSTNADITLKAYPNPIQSSATFEFTVLQDDKVSVDIVSLNGQSSSNIFSGSVNGGATTKVAFDAREFTSGIYFIQVTASNSSVREKIVIIK